MQIKNNKESSYIKLLNYVTKDLILNNFLVIKVIVYYIALLIISYFFRSFNLRTYVFNY